MCGAVPQLMNNYTLLLYLSVVLSSEMMVSWNCYVYMCTQCVCVCVMGPGPEGGYHGIVLSVYSLLIKYYYSIHSL